jgi:hypothetical protein
MGSWYNNVCFALIYFQIICCDRSVVFSGTPVSPTNKTDRHDITEILKQNKIFYGERPKNVHHVVKATVTQTSCPCDHHVVKATVTQTSCPCDHQE